jgi:hypothetical protein
VIRGLAMAVSVFPVDDRLPTLVDLTDEGRASEMLAAALPPGSAGPVIGIELARLGRTTGCVLRYRLGSDGGRPGRGAGRPAVIYAKVGSAAVLDNVRRGLDGLAHRRPPGKRQLPGRGRWLAVPRVVGQSAEHEVMLLTPVPGLRPRLASSVDIDAMVGMAAFAAATIHAAPVLVGPTRSVEGEAAKAASAVETIRTDAPALADWLAGAIDAATDLSRTAASQPVGLAHGDFTPSQLLVDQARVGVLDFDGVCRAEPAMDLGRFLVYMRVAAAKAGLPAAPTLAADLLAAYREAGGHDVSQARIEAYAGLSGVLMAVHSWERLKPGRLRLVCRVLGHQLEHPVPGPTGVASG